MNQYSRWINWVREFTARLNFISEGMSMREKQAGFGLPQKLNHSLTW